MGVRIFSGYPYEEASHHIAVMYCSTSDWAFGPVFYDSDNGEHDAHDRCQLFLNWLSVDPRTFKSDSELEGKYNEFLKAEPELWKARDEVERAKEQEYFEEK